MCKIMRGTYPIPRITGIKELILTALGKLKADTVLKGGILVNVDSGEVLENIDIAIKNGRIAYLGDAEHCIGSETKVINLRGRYVAPGFLDAHIHIESSMLTVSQFAKAVLPHGTTTVFADPHEIANVLGMKGVKLMLDEAKNLPLRVFITAPSCVPAAPGLETPGAVLGPEDVEEMLGWEGVIALGEMMDFPGVLNIKDDVIHKIEASHELNMLVEGHDAGLEDRELVAYAAAGISSSHELTTKKDVINRVRLGMYAYLREGSAWLDVHETIKAATEAKLDTRHMCLVTDDREADTLLHKGHIDDVIRRAIEEGVDPVTAIQMATLNPAQHYRLDRHIGSLAPSRLADIVVLDDLTRVKVKMVLVEGRVVAVDGKMVVNIPEYKYPKWSTSTVNIPRELKPEDFKIKPPKPREPAHVRVIVAHEGSVLTTTTVEELKTVDDDTLADPDRDIYKLAVIERHRGTGNIGLGFVKGFGFDIGAVASTIAHDSHHLIVMGTNNMDMAMAANIIRESGGGITTVKDGQILSLIELPIAGLMSNRPFEEVAEKLDRMYQIWRELGCGWRAPFMTLSLLALPVIPEIRLTDMGLVDVVNHRFLDLFVE